MSRSGRTAVVIPVPELGPVLAAVTARWPTWVRPGVPAHVSVLYPFVPADQLDEAVMARCRRLCARTGVQRVRFERVEVAPGFLAAPVPDGPVAALVRAFATAWPQCPPYGGRFGPDPAAHATLALAPQAPDDELAAAARVVAAELPVTAVLDAAVVVELTDGGWRQRGVLPF